MRKQTDGGEVKNKNSWLSTINFFSEYKFRKRDSSFLLKTKGGKQFIEMDHWIDEATSSLLQDIAILQPLATTCIYVRLMILEVKFWMVKV